MVPKGMISRDMTLMEKNQHSVAMKSLLTAIMIADRKLHKSEMVEVCRAITKLDLQEEDTNENTKRWLKHNIVEIHSAVNGPNKMRWLSLQFLKLRSYPNKDAGLDHLWRVAIADGELHDNEVEIIDSAFRLWEH